MRNENDLRDAIVAAGKSLFERGLTAGSSGNLSVRLDDGWLLTPTNVSLGNLDAARLAKLDWQGKHRSGDRPSKEAPLHLAIYQARSDANAVVHLHATHAAAVSCLNGLDENDCLPPLTAYYVMKIGHLPLVSYHAPGDPALAEAIAGKACDHHAVLLANHGPVVAGESLEAAMYAAEELEETAKLFLLLRGMPTRPLTADQIRALQRPR
jgi:3-dehydro-4-phosphotetronate decarboxylase